MPQCSNSSSWTSFLKSIISFNGDLSKLTAPPFILSPTSLVEYPKHWAEHPELILAPSFIDESSDRCVTEELRMLAVVKWFVSTLKCQYGSRKEKMGCEKKPLNPLLGELFVGHWENGDKPEYGTSVLLSEQVCQNPPITAYTIFNDKNQVRLEGYNQIKASISKMSFNVKQFGDTILCLDKFDEQYLITFPHLHLEGLFLASPCVELEGKSYIVSSTGMFCVFEYSGKGYFSGKKNTFKTMIFRSRADADHKEKAIYNISGRWSDVSYICEPGSKMNSETVFYDPADVPVEPLKVRPIDQQHPLESRKAWVEVAEAIKACDSDKIQKAKSKLEQEKRQLRKQEEALGIDWKRRWFHELDLKKHPEADPIFIKLAKIGGLSINNNPSGTMMSDCDGKEQFSAFRWRFSREKWDQEKEVSI